MRASRTATPKAAAAFTSAKSRRRKHRCSTVLQRAGDDQQENRGHVLKDENCGGGQPDRTILLMSLSDDPGDDGGRGKRQRRTDEQGRYRLQPRNQRQPAETDSAEQNLYRAKPKDVARLLADMREREMQPDIEQQENDAKLGEDRDRVAVGEQR